MSSAIGSAMPPGSARDLSGGFGSALYAKEELVAEMTSAFVCASLGIVPTVRHADYIGSWLEVLRDDDRAIVRAASAASKAADYLLAFRPESDEPVGAVQLRQSPRQRQSGNDAAPETARYRLQMRPPSVRGRPCSP